METIKLAGQLEISPEALQSDKDPAATEIRSLGDWELLLVAGGEGIPVWP